MVLHDDCVDGLAFAVVELFLGEEVEQTVQLAIGEGTGLGGDLGGEFSTEGRREVSAEMEPVEGREELFRGEVLQEGEEFLFQEGQELLVLVVHERNQQVQSQQVAVVG